MPIFTDPTFPKPGERAGVYRPREAVINPSRGANLNAASLWAAIGAPLRDHHIIETQNSEQTADPLTEPPPREPKAREWIDPSGYAKSTPVLPISWRSSAAFDENESRASRRDRSHRSSRDDDAPPAKVSGGLSGWALIGLMSFILIAGLACVSTYFIQHAAEQQIANQIRKAVKPLEATAKITFSGVKVNIFRQAVHVKNIVVQLKNETITIDRATVWGLDWDTLQEIAMTRKPTIPQTVKFQVSGMKIPAASLGEGGSKVLEGMGYTTLALDTYVDLSLSKSRKDFSVNDFQVDLDHMGRLDLSLALGNLKFPTHDQIDRFKKDPKLILTEGEEFTKATIKGFDVTFKDASFIGRASESLMKSGEMSPITLAKLALDVNTPVRQTASIDFVQTSLKTLLNFLQSPTSLTLAAHPAKAIPMIDLFDEKTSGSINDLAHKLNLSLQ